MLPLKKKGPNKRAAGVKTGKNKTGKKRGVAKKVALSLSAVLLALVLGVGTYAVYYFNKIRALDPGYANSNTIIVDPEKNPPPTDEEIEKDKDRIYPKLKTFEKIVKKKRNDPNVENILFLGLDGFGVDRAARSDSMIIISINHKENAVKMVSVLRDMYMKMPNWKGGIKLNEGYHYGGPGVTVNMINYFFDMDIQKYVVVDFEGFPKIIDTVGGVEIEVTQKETTKIQRLNKAGTYILDGQQALDYARIRKIDSDFARARRQRTLLLALLQKFWDANIFTKFSVVDKLSDYVSTNLSAGEIYSLSRNTLDKISRDVDVFTVPSNGNYRQVSSPIFYFYMDYNSQKEDLHNFLYGTTKYVNYINYDLGNRQYDKNNPSKYANAGSGDSSGNGGNGGNGDDSGNGVQSNTDGSDSEPIYSAPSYESSTSGTSSGENSSYSGTESGSHPSSGEPSEPGDASYLW